MRALIQRVSRASVSVGGEVISSIGRGLLVLLGVAVNDGPAEAAWVADKIAALRIFEDAAGKLNRSVSETGGEVLVVSQFTLYADVRKGRRPSFTDAAPPEKAGALYLDVADRLTRRGLGVRLGRFGAHMLVELANDGPVTILIDSELRRSESGRS